MCACRPETTGCRQTCHAGATEGRAGLTQPRSSGRRYKPRKVKRRSGSPHPAIPAPAHLRGDALIRQRSPATKLGPH
jgi:hypothetical protein